MWLRWAKLFHRMAVEEEINMDKLAYDQLIRYVIPFSTRKEVIVIIISWQDKPFFKIEDFLAPNYTWAFGGLYDLWISLKDAKTPLGQGVKPELISKIINWKTELFLADPELYAKHYLDIEHVKDVINPALMEKAKRKMIMRLVRFFTDAQKMNEKVVMKGLLEEWKALYDSSTEISQDFLVELAKRFGVDFYVDAAKSRIAPNQDRFRLISNFLQKDKNKITVYDLALVINQKNDDWWSGGWSKQDFIFLLNKIKHNPELRTYLQGYVYGTLMGQSGENRLFMLDTNLTPMNIQYQAIKFPEHIFPTHLRDIEPEAREKWQQVFNEFGIIPQ